MKYRFAVIFLLVVFYSFCGYAQAKIQTGTFSASQATPNFTLDKNSGDRSMTVEVSFPKGFDVKPQVVVGITLIDADKGANCRFNAEPISISRDGFVVKISTWGDTKIYSIGGSWIAHSE